VRFGATTLTRHGVLAGNQWPTPPAIRRPTENCRRSSPAGGAVSRLGPISTTVSPGSAGRNFLRKPHNFHAGARGHDTPVMRYDVTRTEGYHGNGKGRSRLLAGCRVACSLSTKGPFTRRDAPCRARSNRSAQRGRERLLLGGSRGRAE